jgi:PAS domain S-box-containing protein
MATPEGSKFPTMTNDVSLRMKEQLERSKLQLHLSRLVTTTSLQPIDDRPLPKTLEDALRPCSRAIVVTEIRRPFRIQDVNTAWEGLCGYSYLEAKGRSLGELLGGKETDELAVSALLNQLMRGEDATTILTNYTKTGRKFRNRLHAGPIFDDDGDITHFIGVLQEVQM